MFPCKSHFCADIAGGNPSSVLEEQLLNHTIPDSEIENRDKGHKARLGLAAENPDRTGPPRLFIADRTMRRCGDACHENRCCAGTRRSDDKEHTPSGPTEICWPLASRIAGMKPPMKERVRDFTEIKFPIRLFHLARVLEDGINPLTETVTGGTLDLSREWPPEEPFPAHYVAGFAALIFNGLLTSNQIIKLPNLTKWWWVQNATSGAFTLRIQTPLGALSTVIPQNSRWQLVYCDGNNNIVVSPVQNPQGTSGAREWVGPERERVLTEIFDVACVPLNRRTSEVRFGVDWALERAMFVHRVRKLKRRKEMKVPLRRIANLSRELLKALHELDDEVFQVCRVDRVSVSGLVAALLDVPLRYFAVSQPKKEVSHRPHGSTQNPELRMLILGLYVSIVQEAQGKLTLRKDVHDIRGTLPAVLEILRPYLPEIIPVMLPYETLRDIRKSARQALPPINLSVGQKAP